MPELTTLFVLAGLFLSAIVGEAVLYRDTLRVQINVPPALQEKGFNEPIAEEVFSSEAARIIHGQSVIAAPAIRIHSEPNLLSAIVQPLGLDTAVAALQAQFGVDRLAVVAAIMPGAAKTGEGWTGEGRPDSDEATTPRPAGSNAPPLQMVLVVSQPGSEAAQARLTQADGDPVKLVQRAAQWSMERVVPYRVALAHFLSGTEGDAEGFGLARQTVARALIRPWQPGQAAEHAMLYNVLGLVDTADNDLTGAVAAYRSIDAIPGVPAEVRAQVALNHAIVALALRRPAHAADLLVQATEPASRIDLPGFTSNRRLIEGLVAWGNGDLATAETIFRSVAAEAPLSEAGHHYLGEVLAARGDRDGAATALATARAVHSADPPRQALAVALFWVDPVAGGLTRRF